tara:strand:+ start:1381 stop:2007 length:627 start_codon:yes stop_codon:yes gene_type:complete
MNTIRTSHAFNVEEAVKYGVEKAVLLQHIRFWCVQNEGKKDSLHDGRVWMYQSVEDMHKHYPYWSTHKLHRMLKDMERDGIIVSGNYNKIGYDRTKWYSINIHSANPPNGTCESATPIPDTKEDTKKDTMFEECWKLYGRKGNKQTAMRYWKKLSKADQLVIKDKIPTYVQLREKQYRKDLQGWINPTNRMWEDEIDFKPQEQRIILK